MLKIYNAANHIGQKYITGLKAESADGEVVNDNAVSLVEGDGINFQANGTKLTVKIDSAWKGQAIESIDEFPTEPKGDIIYKLTGNGKLYYYSNDWIEIPESADIEGIANNCQQHAADMSTHVTAAEKAAWSNKEHLLETFDTLPTASASFSGKCIFLTTDNGEFDKYKIYRCQATESNDYEWIDTSIGATDYGILLYGWVLSTASKYRVQDLTADDFNSASTVVITPDMELSLGENPSGALVFAAVPASFNGTVYKHNGCHWEAFDIDNGLSGTGVNNFPVMINGVEYRLFGEFSIVSGEAYIKLVKNC